LIGIARLLDALATRAEPSQQDHEERRKSKSPGYGKWGRRGTQK
jgi:hypothetical protein